MNFHITGSNVSSGKEFGNGRKEIHHDPNGQPRSASEGTNMGQLKQQLWGHQFRSNGEVEFSFR
jgi:hypothetical protein